MSDDLLQAEGLTNEQLKHLFDDAYMEARIDSDGDLAVKDKFTVYLRADSDGRLVAVFTMFGAKPNANDAKKLAYINRVNDQVKVIRASISSNGKFFFDYYIPVEGGISKRAIVMVVRRFFSCLDSALRQDTDDVVA